MGWQSFSNGSASGSGELVIAAGVTIVGQEGVVLSGDCATLNVGTEGVRFGVVSEPGSLMMVNCTATELHGHRRSVGRRVDLPSIWRCQSLAPR